MTIIARNWKCRAGELDIAAWDGSSLVFVEVKTIRSNSRFRPADNLSSYQRKRNCNAAKAYIRAMNIVGKTSRFDLIEITADRYSFTLEHRKNYLPPLPPLNDSSANQPPPESLSFSLLDRFFHRRCPACGAISPGGRFCADCLNKLKFFDQNFRCIGCGGENRGTLDFCYMCLAEIERPWQNAFSLFAYQGFARDLIHRFKFGSEPELARPFAILAAELLNAANISADLIVPVPVNFIRFCQRTYDQAALLAEAICAFTHIPVCHALHRKLSSRSKQSTRSRKERHKGLQNIFIPQKINSFQNKHIILIDDIFTTGTTADAAANVLKKFGASEITLLTIARTIAVSPHSIKKL